MGPAGQRQLLPEQVHLRRGRRLLPGYHRGAVRAAGGKGASECAGAAALPWRADEDGDPGGADPSSRHPLSG